VKNLSIVVPTHNGSRFLLETLSALMTQIESFPGGSVELFVVDSGSNPEESKKTSQIADSLGVKLYVQRDNLGYDLNVLRAISHCNSEYFWLVGDDDLPSDSCIKELMDEIDDRGFDIAIFSTIHGIVPNATNDSHPKLQKSDEFDLFHEVVKEPFLGAAMSSCVFRRDAFLCVELGPFIGLDWIHQSAVLQLAVQDKNFRLSRLGSQVFIRQNSSRWKAHFGSQYLAGLRHLESSSRLPPGAKTDAVRTSMKRSRFKSNHLDALVFGFSLSWSEKILAFKFTRQNFGGEPRFWLIDVPVLFMFCNLWPPIVLISSLLRGSANSKVGKGANSLT
jgi:glycosyltransferase involved in cell wall biosynthesis